MTVLGFLTTDESLVRGEVNDVGIFAELKSEDARTVLKDEKMNYFVAEGDLEERKSVQTYLAEVTGRPPGNVTHPAATVSGYAKLGLGNLINAGTVIDPNAEIGDQNVIHSNVSIGTDAVIGHYCTLGSGATIGANCRIGENVFIGTGAIIFPGVKIANNAKILAGTVVMKPVEEGQTIFGNPGKPL